jgi:hypothetical protein
VSLGEDLYLAHLRIYIEPTRLLPKEVAKLIRCDSLLKVKLNFYLKSNNLSLLLLKDKRLLISTSNRLVICFS